MLDRLLYHFEPKQGWMNDPNGLIRFRGQYHVFFQHNPHAVHWGPMHWGHAVSTDLIHWKEYPIALYPDQKYENTGGCFSGSAIEKDGKLYLFYTSVSKELGQTQSVAVSEDGIVFHKYEKNPVIRSNPLGDADFRDPKVTEINGIYYMVVGSGNRKTGRVLLFESADLLNWKYRGILFEGKEYANCIECPDFFPLGDKYVLMFSWIRRKFRAVQFVIGDFFDGKLINTTIQCPERGYDFYAPQTLEQDGRRIMIGWMYHWGKRAAFGAVRAGALSIPRELKLAGKDLINFPVREVAPLLKQSSRYVEYDGKTLNLFDEKRTCIRVKADRICRLDILEDTSSVEVFLNGGKQSYTWRLR